MKTLLSICTVILLAAACSAEWSSAFEGTWTLTTPDGGAGWLRIDTEGKPFKVDVLWEVGGVERAKDLAFSRLSVRDFRDGEFVKEEMLDYMTFRFPWDHWYMTASGMRRDNLGAVRLLLLWNDGDVKALFAHEKTGESEQDAINALFKQKDLFYQMKKEKKLIPFRLLDLNRAAPMPPAPDVSALKFGDPIELFDGKTLDGWRLTNPKDVSGWSVKDGILTNQPKLEDGDNPPQFGNLRTDREFEDFRLTLEVRLPKKGNSGIYLRGRYEVQVTDSFGRDPSPGMIGAIYSRIIPTANAAKPAGEWQTFDITFADRHVTVILNGQKVIDNQPVEGCTGGALDADDTKPGPIYFQGDHSAVEYRNIRLYPRIKE